MTNIILCGHGYLAEAMKYSVEMVYGTADNVHPLRFEKGQNMEDIVREMQALLSRLNTSDVVIIVDLMGGSPYNAASTLAMQQPTIRVITGMSLPLCLEAVSCQDDLNPNELAEHLLEVGLQCVGTFTFTAATEEEEDFA